MGTKLFVGNLSYAITEQELREAFAQSGRTVQSVRIALDRETQRPRGFAFVELATDADAESAIKQWNGQMLNGRNVFVEKAQERVPGAPRPAPRPRPFGGPGGAPGGAPGGPRPGGGFGAPRPGGYRSGPPRDRYPMASAETNKEEQRRMKSRPEKRDNKPRKGEGRPREEDRERGKWRWDGSED
jgi:RNA recognition motif-containing protein